MSKILNSLTYGVLLSSMVDDVESMRENRYPAQPAKPLKETDKKKWNKKRMQKQARRKNRR